MNLARSVLVATVMLWSIGHAAADGISRLDLGGPWSVSAENGTEPMAATVPGHIHTDLMAAKKIPDPFYRDNEKLVQWVGETNWIYRRSFEVRPELLSRRHVRLPGPTAARSRRGPTGRRRPRHHCSTAWRGPPRAGR